MTLASIIVPVHNQISYTQQCLRAIKNNTLHPFELVIVDNGSSLDALLSVVYILSWFPQTMLLRNSANKGFTIAANQGIILARGEYIVLLNNDVLPHLQWLSKLAECAESDPLIGVVGPKVLVPGTDTIHAMGGMLFTREGTYLPLGRGAGLNDPRFQDVLDCQYVEGSCMLVKRQVLDRVGLFDEVFSPGYFEDADFCFRVREAGFRCVCCPDAVVSHYSTVTASLPELSESLGAASKRNEQVFRQRWAHMLPENPPALAAEAAGGQP